MVLFVYDFYVLCFIPYMWGAPLVVRKRRGFRRSIGGLERCLPDEYAAQQSLKFPAQYMLQFSAAFHPTKDWEP